MATEWSKLKQDTETELELFLVSLNSWCVADILKRKAGQLSSVDGRVNVKFSQLAIGQSGQVQSTGKVQSGQNSNRTREQTWSLK